MEQVFFKFNIVKKDLDFSDIWNCIHVFDSVYPFVVVVVLYISHYDIFLNKIAFIHVRKI